jgi:oxygen-independent coproporphyrinogen-3 oxidase
MAGGCEVEGLNQPLEGPLRHLYVHVPYCHKICPYCSFYKHLPSEGNMGSYGHALLAEARLLKESGVPLSLETVYFGGGTPTLLSLSALEELLAPLAILLDFSKVTEWTMEVNPRTITPQKARLMRQAGVTRTSLGVQAWDESTLHTLGRDHSPAEAEEAFAILRGTEFPVVNLDLMFSVPGQSHQAWQDTLSRSVGLRPDHVSAYNLTYEEDTEFFERCQTGQYAVEEDRDEQCFASALQILGKAGLEQYEISNYGRPGMESRHNQSYWAGDDYAGLGPGAVSTIHGQRFKNIENTTLWQQGALSGKLLRIEAEEITASKWLCERLALSLRTRDGLPASWLDSVPEALARLTSEGLLECRNGRVFLTHRGKFVADGVAAHLWEAMDID